VDDAELMDRRTPVNSALLWNADNAAFSLLGGVERHRRGPQPHPVALHRLRYEDLVRDPRATVASLAAFAGLDLGPAELDFLGDDYADLGPVHTAAGNPIRYRTGRVPLRDDDAWRLALPARERRLVSVACSPLLAAYGYPLTSRNRSDRNGPSRHPSTDGARLPTRGGGAPSTGRN
jgi:hypothetical protein